MSMMAMSTNNLMRGLVLVGIPEYFDLLMKQDVDSLGKFLLLRTEELKTLDIKQDHCELVVCLRSILQLLVEENRTTNSLFGDKDGASRPSKRKYKRHPKVDRNAPQAPPTAYVVFANEFREKHVEDQTAFTEIAKAVGRSWRALSPDERHRREETASTMREQYRKDLQGYKGTHQFNEYMEYRERFKTEEQERQARSTTSTSEPDISNSTGYPLSPMTDESIFGDDRNLATLLPSEPSTPSLSREVTAKQVVQDLVLPLGVFIPVCCTINLLLSDRSS